MEISLPVLTYATILLTSILGLVLGLISFLMLQLLRRYYTLKQEYDALTSKTRLQISKTFESLLSDSNKLAKDSQNEILKNLDEISIKHSKAYEEALITGKKKLEESFNDLDMKMSQAFEGEAKNFSSMVARAATNAQAEFKASLEERKKEMFTRIDSEAFGIIQKATQKLISKSLSRQDHEELVLSALEEAKREGLL